MKNFKKSHLIITLLLMAITWYVTKKFTPNQSGHDAIVEVEKLNAQVDSLENMHIEMTQTIAAKDSIIGDYHQQVSDLNAANQGLLQEIKEDTDRTRTYVRTNYQMLLKEREKKRKLSESARTITIIKD